MEALDYLPHIRADVATLVSAARAEPGAPVVACAGWDRRKLVQHLCVPFGWATAQAEAGPEVRAGFKDADRPGDADDPFDFLLAATERMVAALPAMDAAATWPTWAGPRTRTWFARRMAHEAAVHRWDAAGGPVDTALAVDGIDEVLTEFAPLVSAERFGGEASTLHLHATDTDQGEWFLTLGPESVVSERIHAKGDAAVRGAAGDLYLFAWNRLPAAAPLEVMGDPDAAARWGRTVAF